MRIGEHILAETSKSQREASAAETSNCLHGDATRTKPKRTDSNLGLGAAREREGIKYRTGGLISFGTRIQFRKRNGGKDGLLSMESDGHR
jgi:hypothetical protein